VQAALKARRHRPMFLLDLAVPRDIEASVADLSDVYLYTVDDLEQVIEENRASRREAAEQAHAIIDLQVEHFMTWWRAQGRQDALKSLRNQGEAAREEALARAREQLASGRNADDVVALLAHQLTNRLLHGPSLALRQAALDGDLDLLRAAERLYDKTHDAKPSP
jgi:glutamyl-tRNA reductase